MVAESKRADWIAVAVLAVVLTAILWPVISGSGFYFARDLTSFHFPMKKAVHDLFWRGEFPWWDPFVAAGQPAAANPEYEIFYPGQWPILLPDFFLGYRLHIVLHFFIAALGIYALMRSMRVRPAAALLTAVTFVLSGPFMSAVSLLPTLFALAWMPLTLLFARLAIRDGRPRDAALGAVCFAMQALVLDPALLIATALLVAAYAVYRTAAEHRFRPILIGSVLGAGGVCIAAVQVIPTVDHLTQSARRSGFTIDLIGTWSMPPARLVELIQPYWMGHSPLSVGPYWGATLYGADRGPFVPNLYLGAAVVVAIVTGIAMRSRSVWMPAAAASAAWLLAMGRHTPLFDAFEALHVQIPLRFPERAAFVAALLLTIAAGIAFDRLIADAEWQKRAIVVSIALAIAAVLAVLVVHTAAFAAAFLRMWELQPVDLDLLRLVRSDWMAVAFRIVVLTVLLLIAPRMRREVFAGALIVFTIVELLPLSNEVAPLQPRDFFDEPQAALELRTWRDFRLFVEPEWSSGPVRRRYFSDDRAAPWVFRNALFPRVPAAWGLSTVMEHDVGLTNLAWTNEFVDAMWSVRKAGRQDWAEIFMAMSNVGHRGFFNRFDEEVRRHPGLREIRPIQFVWVDGNERFYFADEIAMARSTREFVDRIVHESHPRRVAYVSHEGIPAGAGEVASVGERSDRIELRVHAKQRGLVVASVTGQKYWRATIDGQAAPIERVNWTYQGVVVPAGEHRVVLLYRNPLITIGAIVSLVSLAIVAFVVWRDRIPNAA